MKRFGRIMFCFLPLLLTLGIQLLVSIPPTAVAFLMALYSDTVRYFDEAMLLFLNYISSGTFNVIVCAIYGVSCIAVFGFWYYKKFRPYEIHRIRATFNVPMLIGIALAVIGLQHVTNYVVLITTCIHPAWLEQYNTLMESVGFDDVSVLLALYSVLIAPIAEELTFRGVTMRYAKKAMPFWVANIFQALLFGIFHMNVIQGVYAFFIALFLGYVYEKSQSLWAPILFHILFNMWGTFTPSWYMYGADQPLFFLLWLIVGIALLTGGLVLTTYGCKKRDNRVKISGRYSDM